MGQSKVILEPVGVVGLITPRNACNGFICGKLAIRHRTGQEGRRTY